MIKTRNALLYLLSSGLLVGATLIETVPIPRENSGKPIPRYVNGYTLFYDTDGQTVAAYDRSGALRNQTQLSLPDGARLTISDVTADASGTLAVAGAAVGSGQQIANLIVWINPDGG
jgi:hypothetical protein